MTVEADHAGVLLLAGGLADEVMRFVHHWRDAAGTSPELLVFDSKVATGAGLADIHAEGITFPTLRQRSPKVIETLEALPDDAWTTVTVDRKGRHRKPQIHEDTVTVRGCAAPLRQIAVRGLGHDHPTLILTNDFDAKPGWLVNRYAKRMAIEQRPAEAIRSFHLDALSSAVALNVDLGATLSVWINRGQFPVRESKLRKLGSLRRHDLRHAAASFWLRVPVSPKLAQRWGGWRDLSTFPDVYQGVLTGEEDAAVVAVSAYLEALDLPDLD